MTREEQHARKMACVEMAKEGKTFKEIAECFGLNENSVRQTCAVYGIRQYKNGRKAPQKISEQVDEDTVIQMLEDGKKPKDIADELNVSTGIIYKISKDNDIRFVWLEKKREKYRKYKSLGYSLSEVAEHFGVGVSEVQLACAGMTRKKSEFHVGHDPWNKGLHTGNQFTNGIVDIKTRVVELVKKANPNMEYVSGYTGHDSFIIIRCVLCGHELQKSMSTIRHGRKTICPNCLQIKPKKTKRLSAEEKERRKAERHEIALANRPMVLARAKAKQLEATRQRQEARRHDCPVCGASTTRKKYCSDACSHKAMNTTHEASRRIKIERNLVDKDITLRRLFARDSGVCWICGMVCDYQDKTYRGRTMIAGDMYPSIDHVIALTDGGSHAWDNVKLAHRICNTMRYYSPRG